MPLYKNKREYFYDWAEIASIYGAPADCSWGGGRVELSDRDFESALSLTEKYGISARLTLSNSLLEEEQLSDRRCNKICKAFESAKIKSGVIVASDLLAEYLLKTYPGLYLVSSTTKVIRDFEGLKAELNRAEFSYVVPDIIFNGKPEKLASLTDAQKSKIELLCNECCPPNCQARKACYENVSRKNLGLPTIEYHCPSVGNSGGYRFSKAMESPAFISTDKILNTYLSMGISNFKIEGRGLGSALILEFLLYYLTKPEYQLHVREEIYLDNMLDIF